jgi:acetyl esterase/lipase
LVGLAFVVNAYFPVRFEPLAVPSFFAGWLTGDLPLHHIAWQAAATAAFVAAGAAASWPGYLALALVATGWAGLIGLHVATRRSASLLEQSVPALGPPSGHQDTMWHGWRLVLPVPVRPRAVEVVKNVPYTEASRHSQSLDVIRSKVAPPSGAPVLLYIHGGAWVIGDKREQGLPMLYELALEGFVCVSANYRLSPRATWPDHIVDVKQAIAWVRSHIAEYGGDPGFVAISGGSAGGHLAALAALSAGDSSYQPGFEDADTSVQACIPLYGVYDMTGGSDSRRYGDGLLSLLEKRVFKCRLTDEMDRFEAASPVMRVHSGAPPFFVLHGANDTLVPVGEARRFVAGLREVSNSAVVYCELPLAQHAFDILASLRTGDVVAAICRFLKGPGDGALET